MNRKEFIKMCGLLGIGLPLQATLSSCNDDEMETNVMEKIIIIGAGAAGLSAAYLLHQQGIDFQILEASSSYGGRMKKIDGFADFPISLGAEWMHSEKSILEEIVNDSSVNVDVATTPYDPSVDYALFDGERVSLEEVDITIDQKFIGSSWFDFYEQFVVPSVRSNISFNKLINAIDYSGDQVRIKTADEEFLAAKVIVTVPVKMLQNDAIAFTPALPNDKLDALNEVTVWDGCKAFIEFTEKFYPAFVEYKIEPESVGQKVYYDAAYGQNTNQHILGFFAVGSGAQPYLQLSQEDLIDYILNELDVLFNGQASEKYVKHIFQNWNAEPHIQGAYINDNEDWRKVRSLGKSVDSKLFFAGTSYTTGDDWGSVHTAARSARRAVEELVR